MRHMKCGKDTKALSFDTSVAAPVVQTRTEGEETFYENFALNKTGGLKLASYTTAALPTAPETGTMVLDTTLGLVVYYNGSQWLTMGATEGSSGSANRSIWIPSSSFHAYTGTPVHTETAGSLKYNAMAFDDTVDESAYASFIIPLDYVVGGYVRSYLYWMQATGSTDVVSWNIDTGSNSFSKNYNIAGPGNTFDHVTTPSDSSTIGSVTPGDDKMRIGIQREATFGSDTMSGDAYMLGVLWTYAALEPVS